jgi:hypothetical protein
MPNNNISSLHKILAHNAFLWVDAIQGSNAHEKHYSGTPLLLGALESLGIQNTLRLRSRTFHSLPKSIPIPKETEV